MKSGASIIVLSLIAGGLAFAYHKLAQAAPKIPTKWIVSASWHDPSKLGDEPEDLARALAQELDAGYGEILSFNVRPFEEGQMLDLEVEIVSTEKPIVGSYPRRLTITNVRKA